MICPHHLSDLPSHHSPPHSSCFSYTGLRWSLIMPQNTPTSGPLHWPLPLPGREGSSPEVHMAPSLGLSSSTTFSVRPPLIMHKSAIPPWSQSCLPAVFLSKALSPSDKLNFLVCPSSPERSAPGDQGLLLSVSPMPSTGLAHGGYLTDVCPMPACLLPHAHWEGRMLLKRKGF